MEHSLVHEPDQRRAAGEVEEAYRVVSSSFHRHRHFGLFVLHYSVQEFHRLRAQGGAKDETSFLNKRVSLFIENTNVGGQT